MNVVILAAGMGKRMQSDLPKVLHPLAGKPLLGHVVDTAKTLDQPTICIVYGHGGDLVPERFRSGEFHFALQAPQLGTGHAVMQAVTYLDDRHPTLVLYGDVPLTAGATLQRLIAAAGDDKLGILTVTLDNPTGYGRIVREDGNIVRIVEQKDATESEQRITETNTGILVAPTPALKKWLAALSCDNAQGEYYLTDIVAAAVREGVPVVSASPDAEWEVAGVNSKVQLAQLERVYQRNLAERLLEQGVTLLDPARLDIRGELTCGRDVIIDVNCIFSGKVHLADGVQIGANCVVHDSQLAAGVVLKPFTHLEQSTVGAGSDIGPFARLRPGSVLQNHVHVGNFVEIKNSTIDDDSKIGHLAYIGDASVGRRVNIGAGTIACNYDGANKHRTVIGDDVFIGSDTQLVAPIEVGDGATIGAGTTLTRNAPPRKLTLSRSKQSTIDNWRRPTKNT